MSYSTVPPCLRSIRDAARVLYNGRSRPCLIGFIPFSGQLQGGTISIPAKTAFSKRGFSLMSFPNSFLF